MRKFMDRHGHRAVFYARFLAGLRAVVYLSAGSLGVPISRFLMYDLLGAVISVPLVVSLGYLFGPEIERILHYIGGIQRALLIVAVLSVLILADADVGFDQASARRRRFRSRRWNKRRWGFDRRGSRRQEQSHRLG